MARPADPNARSALIAAARREFVRHGIQKARIEDITAACGLSKGAFYLHFESKEALFGELVLRVQQRMDAMLDERHREYAQAYRALGPMRGRELAPGAPRRAALEEMELRHDRAALEVIWEHRDVVDVLLRGSQGTDFEGVMWEFVDREVQRVVEASEQLKQLGVCKAELPSEVVGATVVGTWVLLARRMAKLAEKPDLDFWVHALKKLLNEGTLPRHDHRPAKRPATRSSTTRRARRTPRSQP